MITNIHTVIPVLFPYIRSSSASSLLFGVSIGAVVIIYITERSVITASSIINTSQLCAFFIDRLSSQVQQNQRKNL